LKVRSLSQAARAATFFAISAVACGNLRAANLVYTDLYSLQASASLSVGPSSFQQAANGGQVVSYAVGPSTASQDVAVVWNPAPGVPVVLNPTGYLSSSALGTDGIYQVGEGISAAGQPQHAVLWAGTPDSAVDLDPLGFFSSVAYSVAGAQQVGSGEKTGSVYHAMLWTGSASSAIDLTPHGFQSAVANGTNGTQQVGSGSGSATGNVDHALLWSGTAASMIDLHPTNLSGFVDSFALGVGGSQQVGYGIIANQDHQALLWRGTAASAVNLNPTGFSYSTANGTNGIQQVGAGYGTATDNTEHALLWNGSANSYVDLGAMLPSNFTRSFAFSIDSAGDVFGYAEQTTGVYDAIEWQDVSSPEPASAAAFGLTGFSLLARRRRRVLAA
jgi:hypothetical protein